MKKEYSVDNIDMYDVIRIEQKLYKLYREAILDFKKSFSLYKCNIETIDCWTTNDFESATNIRPNLDNKYVYWICYTVLHNGKPVIYDNENSPLTRNYSVLVISKVMKHNKLKFIVEVFDDTEDVKEELVEDLKKLEQLTNQSKTGDGSQPIRGRFYD